MFEFESFDRHPETFNIVVKGNFDVPITKELIYDYLGEATKQEAERFIGSMFLQSMFSSAFDHLTKKESQ